MLSENLENRGDIITQKKVGWNYFSLPIINGLLTPSNLIYVIFPGGRHSTWKLVKLFWGELVFQDEQDRKMFLMSPSAELGLLLIKFLGEK